MERVEDCIHRRANHNQIRKACEEAPFCRPEPLPAFPQNTFFNILKFVGSIGVQSLIFSLFLTFSIFVIYSFYDSWNDPFNYLNIHLTGMLSYVIIYVVLAFCSGTLSYAQHRFSARGPKRVFSEVKNSRREGGYRVVGDGDNESCMGLPDRTISVLKTQLIAIQAELDYMKRHGCSVHQMDIRTGRDFKTRGKRRLTKHAKEEHDRRLSEEIKLRRKHGFEPTDHSCQRNTSRKNEKTQMRKGSLDSLMSEIDD